MDNASIHPTASYYLSRSLIFLCIVALSVSLGFGQKKTVGRQTKTTLTAATKKTDPFSLEGSSRQITFEKYSSSYELNSDGTAIQTLEVQARCNDKDCIDQLAKFRLPYNGDLQLVKTVDAYILRADGRKTAVPTEAIKDRVSPQGEAAPGFSSLRILEISFDDLAPGDSAGHKIEIRTLKPVFGKNFSGLETFPLIYNWNSIDVDVTAASDYPVFFEADGLSGGKTADANGRAHWHWNARDVRSVPVEMAMTDLDSISPHLSLTTFKEFAELGSYFGEAVRNQAVVTPEIEALANKVTQGISDPALQAAAIYKWVNQNVRYLQTYVGRDGWVPHRADRILANEYGDCKDYTTLIYTLLKVKGIESVPVLTRLSGSDWFPTVAAMSYFNHAILYIPSLNAIADATAPNTRLGDVSQLLVGKKMLLSGSQPGLLDIPRDRPKDNRFESEVTVTYGDDGTLRAHSLNSYYGRAKMLSRGVFDSAPASDPQFIKIMLGILGVGGNGRVVKTTDVESGDGAFAVEFESEIPGYGGFARKGKLTIPVGVNMQNVLAIHAFLKAETRRTSLIVGAQTFNERYILKVPTTVTLGQMPPPLTIDSPVGRIVLSYKLAAGGAEIDREVTINKDVITPQEYPQFRDFVQKGIDAEKIGVDYTSTSTVSRSGQQQQLGGDSFSLDTLVEKLLKDATEKPITSRQALGLEQSLKTHPEDVDAHRRLAVYYNNNLHTKKTAASASGRLRHRLWFVEHHPEISDRLIFNADVPEAAIDSEEYQVLRDAWLKQVAANKNNAAIRLNAADFIGDSDEPLSMRILTDGIALDPTNYQFPLTLTERLNHEIEDPLQSSSDQKEARERLLAIGEKALALIKVDRSEARDRDRFELLKRLCKVSIDLGETAKAKAFAQELILDYGPSPSSVGKASATHLGNITLGQAALAEGDIGKAKEYLLIAIRAPLRLEHDDIDSIDMKLASALFAKGEHSVVVEYLKLCLDRNDYKKYPSLYKSDVEAITTWLTQIEAGKTPTFDLSNPDSK
jgi:hypothetical protein